MSVEPFLADLVRLRKAIAATAGDEPPPAAVHGLVANPTLRVLALRWKGLPGVVLGNAVQPPMPGEELVLVWRPPGRGEPSCRAASASDLLALKVAVERLDPREAAREGGQGVWVVQNALRQARADGLLLAPASILRRPPGFHAGGAPGDPSFLTAESFTLQWHVTQACDLRCKHCYDRSDRPALALGEGIRVLDELFSFCRDRDVAGQVTFSGGNPLLHPDFLGLYREAQERGFTVGILGNPASRAEIEEILAVGPLDFFQVSLEGLRAHDDLIRGPGHWERTMTFLDVLRDLGVYSLVMLTLTSENLGEVLALGKVLRGRADVFHFNRLSPVGEGARLALPGREEYLSFLKTYGAATRENPVLGCKDNLLSRVDAVQRDGSFGGCTGHGCGAAFNFVSLLADGEGHACRKFPSHLGSVLHQGLAEIYDSEEAHRYRAGAAACGGCNLRPRCGGCMASASGFGLDPFRDRDPFCPGAL
ncbi:MAG: selenobiotic family peptide radical SAM maturase [Deltaproteobacteria bacterium]|nr:selenobiotic family peptide radical SAM maturase [Deltaproteobacteria bacterium]